MASAGTAPARIQSQPDAAPTSFAASVRMRSGARWFYWIAGLSVVNSIIGIAGGNLHFVVGLGITQAVDAIAKPLGNPGMVLDLIINGVVAGIFALFGAFATKGQKWAFLTGMVLYSLDGLLLLAAKDLLSVGFHAYALFAISRGLMAIGQTSPAQPSNAFSAAPIQPS